MFKNINSGVYPTMITPYKEDGSIDFNAVDKLVEWYWKKGCNGIFASCQSSEIFYLSLKERVELTKAVVKKVNELNDKKVRPYMSVVASGHISENFEDQVEELNAIANCKPDAVILITNRMDIVNSSDDQWIKEMLNLIEKLPKDMPLGLYEAPVPYKRLLSDKMLKACVNTGRFALMKDTSCNIDIINKRNEILKGTSFLLLNANAQTLLDSVRSGGSGYCGVMANFYPEVIIEMLKDPYSDRADKLEDFICFTAFSEYLSYPVIAKYHLSKNEGLNITLISRSRRIKELPKYDKDIIDRLNVFSKRIMND